MPLITGARLGPYEIVAPLGAGGMGEVYRARDTRLGRDVAVKVLPAGFSADQERLSRFEQEARAAAALNHPNILAVHDIGQHDGAPFIVSELLEGETLRERMNAGALPVRKAVEYAVQVAHGLAAAHEKGIVHRDLKPENIFVTSDSRVKILDFGLAKLTQVEPAGAAMSVLPTIPPKTEAGIVLGTMGYMSPEQVRGLSADHRSDLFAFGAVLYEMLSGQRAFRGDTTADTMGAILMKDPPDLPVAEQHIPPALARIVDRCLEKTPAARFQSTRDLAFALESLSSHTQRAEVVEAIGAAPARRSRERLAWGVAALAVAGLVAAVVPLVLFSRRVPVAPEEMRLEVSTPPTSHPALMALSPDGRRLVFVATAENQTQLFLRDLASTTARPLAGTEGALYPFWSPDSRSVAFFSTGKLQRVDLAGGSVQTLAPAASPSGGSWNGDGTIIFAPVTGAPLMRVSARGGEPVAVTRLALPAQTAHRAPRFLPDGRHFVYFAQEVPVGALYLGTLDGLESVRLVDASSGAIYVPPGYLLFVRGVTLFSQPFDAGRLQLAGEPVPVAQQVPVEQGFAGVSAAAGGVVAFRTVASTSRRLAWYDRSGKEIAAIGGLPEAAVLAGNPELSPDGTSVAFNAPGNANVWLLNMTRDVATPLTVGSGSSSWPVWTPDGRRIIFRSTRKGPYDLYQRLTNGAGSDELLLQSPVTKSPEDVSPDGRFLMYRVLEVKSRDLWALPLQGDRKPFPVVNTEFEEREGQFEPGSGRWIAYVSNASGRFEVYVQPFPGAGGKWQVSTAGGFQPRWRHDGKELFYLGLDGALKAVSIMLAPDGQNVGVGKPIALFRPRIAEGAIPGINRQQYAVTPDGQRFLVITEEEGSVAPVTVVLNWAGAAKR
jgi:Tol biopolymer transport system component